jgi:hypothetical protein
MKKDKRDGNFNPERGLNTKGNAPEPSFLDVFHRLNQQKVTKEAEFQIK